jgi:hypothetical protein
MLLTLWRFPRSALAAPCSDSRPGHAANPDCHGAQLYSQPSRCGANCRAPCRFHNTWVISSRPYNGASPLIHLWARHVKKHYGATNEDLGHAAPARCGDVMPAVDLCGDSGMEIQLPCDSGPGVQSTNVRAWVVPWCVARRSRPSFAGGCPLATSPRGSWRRRRSSCPHLAKLKGAEIQFPLGMAAAGVMPATATMRPMNDCWVVIGRSRHHCVALNDATPFVTACRGVPPPDYALRPSPHR